MTDLPRFNDGSLSDAGALPRWVAALPASPARALALLMAFQMVFWVVIPWAVSSAPPLDVAEGLVWGPEWLLGTHKHPPLPAWLIELSVQATSSPLVGPYLLSQISVVLTYFFVFLIGRRMTSPGNALAATFLLASIFYFTWPTPEFNHNVVQLPIWSGSILLFTILRARPRAALPWLGLGLLAGFAIYAKYSVAILYAVLLLWLLWEAKMRAALLSPWPWLAGALAVLVAAPHIGWLVDNDFAPFQYARDRAGEASWLDAPGWVVTQLAIHLPLLIFLAIIGISRIRALPRWKAQRSDFAFVATMALGPLVMTAVLSVATGAGIRDMWGMPMFSLSGLLLIFVLGKAWNDDMVRRALGVAIGFTVTFAILYGGLVKVSEIRGSPKRNAWPMAEISEKATSAWHNRTSAPLAIVSGDMWLAGLIASGGSERPRVVYDGKLSLSPWMSEKDLQQNGALYVWAGATPPAGLIGPDVSIDDQGTFHVEGTRFRDGIIGYAVRLPE